MKRARTERLVGLQGAAWLPVAVGRVLSRGAGVPEPCSAGVAPASWPGVRAWCSFARREAARTRSRGRLRYERLRAVVAQASSLCGSHRQDACAAKRQPRANLGLLHDCGTLIPASAAPNGFHGRQMDSSAPLIHGFDWPIAISTAQMQPTVAVIAAFEAPIEPHASPIEAHTPPIEADAPLIEHHAPPMQCADAPISEHVLPIAQHATLMQADDTTIEQHASPMQLDDATIKPNAPLIELFASPI